MSFLMCFLFQPDYSVNQMGHQRLHCKCVCFSWLVEGKCFENTLYLETIIIIVLSIIITYYRLVTGDSPDAYEERPDWAKASKYSRQNYLIIFTLLGMDYLPYHVHYCNI